MTVFTINFRREVFVRERARARARLLALGGWLLYFGLLVVVTGLYGLNCASLVRRVEQVERRTARLKTAQGTTHEWTVDQAQLAAVEHFYSNPRRWRDKMLRLSALLPSNVAVSSINVNPENNAGSPGPQKLMIAGQLRPLPTQDPMRGVVQLLAVLQKDPVFSSGYQTIKLTQSRIAGSSPSTEFVIECR